MSEIIEHRTQNTEHGAMKITKLKPSAIIFDINGTLVDIETDEHSVDLYRAIAHFLSYKGISIRGHELKDLYFNIMKKQLDESKQGEKYPEINVIKIWMEILLEKENKEIYDLSVEVKNGLPAIVALLHRGISRKRLKLYPRVYETLSELYRRYPLAIVSDAQVEYAMPELNLVKISHFFSPIIISGRFGFRKPDERLFRTCLDELNVLPEDTIFVGNDIFHDVYGAKQIGMKTVLLMTPQGDKKREDAKPDFVFSGMEDILDIVE